MISNEASRMREALTFIPANCDRETWFRVLASIKSELSEDGREVADEWSASAADSYSSADFRAVWKSIRAEGGITGATVYGIAKENGWNPRQNGHPVLPTHEALERRKAAQRQADEREAAEQAAAAIKAQEVWTKAEHGAHPYCERKGVAITRTMKRIRADALARILGYEPASSGEKLSGWLLVLPIKVGSALSSLEFIDESGKKSALHRGRKRGGYWSPSSLPDGDGAGITIYIAEGAATALSAWKATNSPTIAAFSDGNLPAAAQAMRARYPQARIVVIADLGNGEKKAHEAARAVGGLVALPTFHKTKPEGAKDFNDMHQTQGIEAVKTALQAPQPPAPLPEPQAAPVNRSGAVLEGGWPQPQPLPKGLPAVKAFSADLMPDALRPWVMDIGERLQCPVDFVGVAVMVGLGSVIGRRIGIRPQDQTDWTEYPNLWGCIVGRPSVMKSPALDQGQAPLRRLAAKAMEAYLLEQQVYEGASHLAKLRQDTADAEIRKRLKNSVNANVSDLMVEAPTQPQLKRYIANDTSYESLGALLGTNPNGLLVFRDELVSLLKNLDREDNAGARGFYLTGWAGNSPYTFDRITRQGAALDAVCISLLGSTQPGRIADYIRAAVKGGAGDDGLMQRFGMLVWPDTGREWKDVDRQPDAEAKRSAFEVFDRLDRLDPQNIGAHQDTDRDGNPFGQPFLRLNPEALAIFREWREAWENRLTNSSDLPALDSHFAKYRKLVPALALISHLADNEAGDVGAVAVLRALAWAEYLETHARRAYASLETPEHLAAEAIIQRLRKGELPSPFQARDVYRKQWAHLSDRQLVTDALELLADLDWLSVSELTAKETGGRPARLYVANPRGLAQ